MTDEQEARDWDEMIHRKRENAERGISEGDRLWQQNKHLYSKEEDMPEESDCKNLPKVANKRIGSDFNEFYIEALEATILDLTGKSPEDKEKLEAQIAKRKIGDYMKTLDVMGNHEHRFADKVLWNACLRIIDWLDKGGE